MVSCDRNNTFVVFNKIDFDQSAKEVREERGEIESEMIHMA